MHKKSDPRRLALSVYEDIMSGNTVQNALDNALKKEKLSFQDVSLCTELVYGFCRYSIRIDAILAVFLKKPKSLPSRMRCILGFSVYEILFLDKVPVYASISTSVNRISKLFGKKMGGLANALLRKISQETEALLSIEFYKERASFYSVQGWQYTLFVQSYGQENAEKILFRSLQRPKTCIRLNPLHAQYKALSAQCALHAHTEKLAFSAFAFLAKKPPTLLGKSLDDWHSEGALSWQSAASQEVLFQCLAHVPRLSERPFYDACAGQGGKSFILLEQGKKVHLASDTSLLRLRQFKKTAQRLNLTSPHVVCQSASALSCIPHEMSMILDVPCSGFGTLARRPEIRIRRTQEEVQQYILLQSEILKSVWASLSIYSHIIYITCTLNPAENEGQIQNFLQGKLDARLVFEWQTPHSHPWLEGMYVAVIEKIQI